MSAGVNVGLSIGITDPSMPAGLKLIYAFQMWAGGSITMKTAAEKRTWT